MVRETCYRITPRELAGRLPTPAGKRFIIALTRGELQVELYKPVERDLQTPHSRDECYIVLEGSGTFVMGDHRVPFAPGDFLFVPAGIEHRFEDFGDEMSTWVIFFGPEGGEQA